MTRKERRAINRANAALSTGPVTSSGKAVSSRNAVKHGLTSMKAYLPHEEQAYLAEMDRYLDMYDPQTDDEHQMVETLVDLEWRLLRIPALEARLFSDQDADPHKTIRALDTLSRHEVRLRKLAKTTCENLNAMQTARSEYEANGSLQKGLANCRSSAGFVLQNPGTASNADHIARVTHARMASSAAAESEIDALLGRNQAISRSKAA